MLPKLKPLLPPEKMLEVLLLPLVLPNKLFCSPAELAAGVLAPPKSVLPPDDALLPPKRLPLPVLPPPKTLPPDWLVFDVLPPPNKLAPDVLLFVPAVPKRLPEPAPLVLPAVLFCCPKLNGLLLLFDISTSSLEMLGSERSAGV